MLAGCLNCAYASHRGWQSLPFLESFIVNTTVQTIDYLTETPAAPWLCANTCGDGCSIQLQGCGYGGKGGYIQVGVAPPQVLIVYLHQPPLHMAVLHYQLRQQLHSAVHCQSVSCLDYQGWIGSPTRLCSLDWQALLLRREKFSHLFVP